MMAPRIVNTTPFATAPNANENIGVPLLNVISGKNQIPGENKPSGILMMLGASTNADNSASAAIRNPTMAKRKMKRQPLSRAMTHGTPKLKRTTPSKSLSQRLVAKGDCR